MDELSLFYLGFSMLAYLARRLSGLSSRLLPDPFVIACSLSILVYVVALFAPGDASRLGESVPARSTELLQIWLDGIFSPGFLRFALQMCLILVAGFGLSHTPFISRVLDACVDWPRTLGGAVYLVALCSCLTCWINWGFGLVISGTLAARLLQRIDGKANEFSGSHRGLIMASAFCGMMIWHGGLSGSAPLLVASGVELADLGMVVIPVGHTLLSLPNLALTALLWLVIPVLMVRMLEPEARRLTLRNVAHEESPGKPTVFSESAGWGRLASRLAGLFVGTGLLTALAFRLWQNGLASVDLNFVIAVFLGLGFLLHRDVQSFAQAMSNGGRSVTGVIIQFPLYAGIQAMMSESGLAEAVSSWFAESAIAVAGVTGVSPCQCLPPAIFLSAGAVNLLVPSGGGQWIVQGPMVLRAAYEVGVDHATAVMALSYGDQWTNMIQPFWAIPLLGLTRVPLRLFAGYCFLLMVLVVPLFLVTLAVMSIL